MEPIDEMSAEIARSLEGVIFDFDDTLTRQGVVEEEAFAALYRLREAGLKLVLITGRPLTWAEVLAAIWPIDVAIGENGAGWYRRQGRALRLEYFEEDVGERERQRAVLERVRAHVRAYLPEVREAADAPLRRCDVAFDVGETVKLPASKIDELVRLISACGARTMLSTVHAHAIPGRWDKAEGAVRAGERALGVSRERLRTRWIFVGDSENDAAAFSFFEHAAGVANVRDHAAGLPRAPRWIARSDRGRGFAEIAARIVEKRSGA
jgi:HAD superfamily hydrolase (TIGR01484 family)